MIDLGLGSIFPDGATAASNSVDPEATKATVEQHNFRADSLPDEPRPVPPPPYFDSAMPLFSGSSSSAFEHRERELRRYAAELGKHEAARGFAWGQAVSREHYDQAVRQAELDRDLARQQAAFSQAHPPTAMGVLGQAAVPWFPVMMADPLFRMLLQMAIVGGVVFCAWAFGQRLLPKEMRS